MGIVKGRANESDAIEQEMQEGSITLFLVKKGMPAVLSVVIAGLYNLVDTYFVSGLGSSAVAGVSVVYAGVTLVQTLAYVIGMGASGMISTALGEDNEPEARCCIRTGCVLAVVTAVIILVLGIAIPERIMQWLGATDTSIAYAMEYGKWVIWSAPFMLLQMVLGNFLRGLNNTSGFMMASIAGGGVHIILCWWLVIKLEYGAGGAGIATLAGQVISLVVLLVFWWQRDNILCLKDILIRGNVRCKAEKEHKASIEKGGKCKRDVLDNTVRMAGSILKNGMPSLARQGSASLSLILLNQVAGRYSDEMLSAISIANKIVMIFYSVAIGLSQGYQPLAGYLYGAEQNKRLKKVFFVTLAESTVLMTIMGIVAYCTADWTTSLFYAGYTTSEMAIAVLCWQAYTLPIIFLNNLVTMSYQTIQKALPASILSMLRQGICYIPLLYLLPALFDVWGFMYLQPAAELITFIVTVPFAVHFLKQIS